MGSAYFSIVDPFSFWWCGRINPLNIAMIVDLSEMVIVLTVAKLYNMCTTLPNKDSKSFFYLTKQKEALSLRKVPLAAF